MDHTSNKLPSQVQTPQMEMARSSSAQFSDPWRHRDGAGIVRRTPTSTYNQEVPSNEPSSTRRHHGSETNPFDMNGPIADEADSKLNRKPSIRHRASSFFKKTKHAEHSKEIEPDSEAVATRQVKTNRAFLMKLSKALLSFGSPAHRVEDQLRRADEALQAGMLFTLIPNTVMVTLDGRGGRHQQTRFVKATGKTALTKLQMINKLCFEVTTLKKSPEEATKEIDKVMKEKPMYPALFRCGLAFITSAIICGLSFGGSVVDMTIAGAFGFWLRYLAVSSATSSAIYGNVYEISLTFVISFVAKALSVTPGNHFCYGAISSASIVSILPGYTILIASLELTGESWLNGTAKLVYAIVYTLFLGFSLTIGKDMFLAFVPNAQGSPHMAAAKATLSFGSFLFNNGTGAGGQSLAGDMIQGSFDITVPQAAMHQIKGCYRDPTWGAYLQPLPWWTLFILVPIYSGCSTLSNLQRWRDHRFVLMIIFSCLSWGANKAAGLWLHSSPGTVSAAGAIVISILGSIYGQFAPSSAFTTMVPGVLFLVPSSIAQSGALAKDDGDANALYGAGFSLALRTIQVAIGVSIGLFVGQSIVLMFSFCRRTMKWRGGARYAF